MDVHERLRRAQEALDEATVARQVALEERDAAMVEAHNSGLSSREIGELVGMDQANVVRARRRAAARAAVPQGFVTPSEAIRLSGLGVREFVARAFADDVERVVVGPGQVAFRRDDVCRLAIDTPA